ncbi:MAG: DUF1338 domain-containing protein [Kofleriaceae bacterium]
MTTKELLEALWADFVASTPQAERIHALLAGRGETIRNDHIALRTYDAAGIGISAIARVFEEHGWIAQPDEYTFEKKHLRARYWRHADPALPKVFISELVLAEMSPALQASVAALVAQLPEGFAERPDLPWAGRPWQLTHGEYEALLAESQYAAWVAAFGFRVNHFTVDVNALSTFPDLAALDAYLVEHGFTLNDAGGAIKGSRATLLEQSSTRADSIDVVFADATVRIPSCYYEFAKRYALPSGELFQGFLPTSANKIFESTDARVKTD